MTKKIWKSVLVLALVVGTSMAQSGKEKNVEAAKVAAAAVESEIFHLVFVLKELEDGKVVNSRGYSMMTVADSSLAVASTRTRNKVPIGTGAQYQFMEVGVNIDCSAVRRLQNRLVMVVSADLTTLASPPEKTPSSSPGIRDNRWKSCVIVPIGKPTVLFSSDDVTSRRTLQLELMATPLK